MRHSRHDRQRMDATGPRQNGNTPAYSRGDVLACADCGYRFVNLHSEREAAWCRRCRSAHVNRWHP